MLSNLLKNRMLDVDGGTNGGNNNADGGADSNNNADNNANGDDTNKTTFDDLLKNKEYQSAFDKKIAKALETAKSKWETDYNAKLETEKTEAQKLAKMTADQKAQYELQQKMDEFAKREKEFTAKELKLEAYKTLASKGLPSDLVEILNYESAETCNTSIEAVSKAFQSAVESAVNKKLKGGQAPRTNNGNNTDGSIFNFGFSSIKKTK